MGTGSIRNLLGAIAVALVALHAACAVAASVRLQVGITGQNTLEGLDDPVRVLKLPEVSALFQDIAKRPRSSTYIHRALSDSQVDLERLLGLGLLTFRDGAYVIDFNYLTTEDHATLVRVLESYAESLAQSYRDRWSDFRVLLERYNVGSVSAESVAFVVLGAISLDWDGLDITAETGLRIPAERLPGNRTFVVWARELAPGVSLREMYWGSHNEIVGNLRFTTFGDHHVSPRLALPDLVWVMGCQVDTPGVPPDLELALHEAAGPCPGDEFYSDVGTILEVLRREPATPETLASILGTTVDHTLAILRALELMQYIDATDEARVLAVPYFSAGDGSTLSAARELSRQIIADWLARNHARLQADLGDLTALHHGVPYEQLFTEIWHYLFGQTNRALVRSGHFADPYAPDRLSKGIIPFVMYADLLNLHTEASR